MHMPEEFLETVTPWLSGFYLLAGLLNVAAAVAAVRRGRYAAVAAWLALAVVFGLLGGWSLAGRPPVMPDAIKAAVDGALSPVTLMLGVFATLVVLYLGRAFFVKPAAAWAGFNASLLFLGLSMTDPVFASIVTRADNVPIVGMVYLLALFTWLGVRQAVENDRRMAAGDPPAEKDFAEKFLTWPDLVYPELICMILLSTLLVVWSLVIPAPLEQPANPIVTPNPSKAPWYFLGLQEMLVYGDPWLIGVVVPCLIVFGLMAIPYLDRNPAGAGYYTIDRRRFAFLTFQFGFLMLWVLLILVGTFFRGPNWNFCGLYEVRDPHKIVTIANVKLSEYVWLVLLGGAVPQPPAEAGPLGRLGWIVWREIAGVALLAGYFLALPPILAHTAMKGLRRTSGAWRFYLMTALLLVMLLIPLKMILRWTFHLSYLVSMPEYLLNI